MRNKTSNGQHMRAWVDPLDSIEELSGISLDNDVLLMVDTKKQTVLEAIPGDSSFCGWSREQMLSMVPQEILPSFLFSEYTEPDNRWLNHRVETQIICGNGHKRDVEVFIGTLPGNGIQFYLVHDITRRKHHHTALARFITVLGQTQAMAGIGFYERNLVSGKDYWSDELFVLFGLDAKNTTPNLETLFTIVHPSDLQKIKQSFDDSRINKKPSDIILRIVCPDGSSKVLRSISTYIYDDNGNPTYHRGTFLDITKSQQLLYKIAESEEKFRSIINNSEEILYQVDTDGVITYIAGKGLARLGTSAEKLIGSSFSKLLEAYPKQSKNFDRALSGIPVRDEIHIRNQHLRLWYSPLHDRMNQMTGLIGMAVNVTDEYNYKKKLEDRENYITSVFCNIHEDIYIINRDYRILDVNRKVLLTNGMKKEEVIGQPCYWISHGIDHPCDMDGVDCYLKQVFDTGNPADYRHTHVDNQGDEKVVDIIISPVRNASGQIMEVIEASRDVTELVKAERARHIRDIEFSTVINTAKEAVVGIDPDGRIFIWNPAAEQMFGHKRKDIMGKPLHSLIVPNRFRESALQGMETFFQTGEGHIIQQTVEITAIKKDGTEFPIELSISPMNLEGKWHATAFIRDITERKQEQNELQNALKNAKQGERAKTIFLENISHEIRTPLNAILGFTESLKENIGAAADNESQLMFDYIQQGGQRLLHTVQEILDMAQLETQSFGIKSDTYILEDLIREVITTVEPEVREKGLYLRKWGLSKETEVHLDRYSFHNALRNLVQNAVKYTQKGGITIRLAPKTDHIELSVIDTGIGMTSHYLNRAFDPFTQESEGRNKKFQGIGLGIALAKRYLELNQIELELDSKVNKGTRVLLRIPTFNETRSKRKRPVSMRNMNGNM